MRGLLVGALGLLSACAWAKPQGTPAGTECGEGQLSEAEKAHPESVAPEPTAPTMECSFSREVRCLPPSPTRRAWQLAPFAQCPRTTDRWSADIVKLKPMFSRSETRRQRLRAAGKGCSATPTLGECCYVQFSTMACD